MVISQTFWRGWRAVAGDGRRLELRRANHAFMAVRVPSGRTSLHLFYRPPGWRLAWTLCGGALAVVAATLLVRRRMASRGRGELQENRR